MYSTAALLDIHERTHRSTAMTLAHLASLPADDLRSPLEGFSYPTVVAQVHHFLAAERYWMSVLQGELRVDDDADAHESVEALQALQQVIAAETRGLLGTLSDAEVSAARPVTKWNGDTMELVPALAVLRTQTHAFQHRGEIASMLRQLGHPFPPMLDFPLG